MNILELKEIRNKKGLSRKEFANKIGITKDTLDTWEYRTKVIPLDKIEHIKHVFNMYADSHLQKDIHTVPYYDIDVTSHITTSFNDVPETPTYYVDYAPFNDCTAIVNNYGDSMFPKYKNGDRLAIKQLFNLDTILWGETYLVVTNENANDMRTVKDVFSVADDDSKIILRASNPNYAGDTFVNKEDILSIYISKGKLGQNIM
jgi:transcriptional regulator with XRE-family HTH domain